MLRQRGRGRLRDSAEVAKLLEDWLDDAPKVRVQTGDLPPRDDNLLGQLLVALATVGEVVGLLPVGSIFVVVVLRLSVTTLMMAAADRAAPTIHIRH